MLRAKRWGALGGALAVLLLSSCSNVIHFTSGRPAALDASAEITAIDGRNMTRAELESLAAEYQFMARWSARVWGDEDFEDKLQEAVEKAKEKTRQLGYRMLFFTDDSEMVAIVMQDAHAVGPSDRIIMYALRAR